MVHRSTFELLTWRVGLPLTAMFGVVMVGFGLPFLMRLLVGLALGILVAAVVEDGRPRLMWATLAGVFYIALLAVLIRL